MEKVTLHNIDPKGYPFSATFAPSHGMNLLHYQKGDIDVIDQQTWGLFHERYAGLGALIGPHFHHRQHIPLDFNTTLFPHIARVQAKGTKEPFSHGLARYASWDYVASDTQIQAKLTGSTKWKGIYLKDLEGMDFELTLEIRLLPNGLFLKYTGISDLPSVLGLHYYYTLPSSKGYIHSNVKQKYRDQNKWQQIPKDWLDTQGHLNFPVQQQADFGFLPILHEHEYRILYQTSDFEIHINFLSENQEEVSFQIFRPEKSSYVCIEPITAQNPLSPKINHSILETKIEIII